MKIKYIKIKNMGPFLGDNNELDLNSTHSHPFVLIGGRNGSGKTTLLKLIKLAIHGNYALGYKINSSAYLNEIQKLIHFNMKEGDHASLLIELELNEDYYKNNYKIMRTWTKKGGKITEKVKVQKNDQYLTYTEMDTFFDRLKYSLPAHLLDASFFNGEELHRLINNKEALCEFLRHNFNVLFDLDVFRILEQDLNTYLRSEILNEKNSSDEQQLMIMEDRLSIINKQIKFYGSQLEQLIEQEKQLNEIIELRSSELEKLGKLNEDIKSKYIDKLKKYENEKINHLKEIREFLESDYPLYLNFHLMSQIKNRIIKEKNLKFIKYIDEILKSHLYIPKEFKLNDLRNYLKQDATDELYFTQYNLENELSKLSKNITSHILSRFDRITYLQKEIQQIKLLLQNNEMAMNYVPILEELENAKLKLNNVYEKIDNYQHVLEELKGERSTTEKQYQKQRAKVRMNKRFYNTLEMAEKIKRISRNFRNKQLRKLLPKIEQKSIELFNQAIRKENYIKGIKINADTFYVSILLTDGTVKELSFLSAGEQQILITSIIAAYFKLSKKKMHFVIDTPLARLDTEHKTKYVVKLLSNISSQVIILSTDSEVNREIYEQIKDKIHQEYTLENVGVKTEIRNGYFYTGVS